MSSQSKTPSTLGTMDSRPHVLIADDEAPMARLIARSLQAEGFKVSTVDSGEAAIERTWETQPDVLLLDIRMPGLSGLDVIRELHDQHPVPIIVVSGQDGIPEISTALDLGAADYLAKPFSGSELAARIRAVLRRQRTFLHGRRIVGDAVVDFDHRTIEVNGVRTGMSRRAWRLLEHLVKLDGAIATHDELLGAAFGPAYLGDAAYLRLWIGQLRRSLGIAPWDEGVIRTIPGIGYSLDVSDRVPRRSSRRPRTARVAVEPPADPAIDQPALGDAIGPLATSRRSSSD